MAKKHTEITDKQTAIKTYMRNQFLLQNVIDGDGNILDLNRFHDAVAKEIRQCQKEMAENETINGVVKDQMLQSVLIGDLDYLKSVIKHTKNINPWVESPVVSHEDLPKKRNVIKAKYQNTKLLIRNKLANWLIR